MEKYDKKKDISWNFHYGEKWKKKRTETDLPRETTKQNVPCPRVTQKKLICILKNKHPFPEER